MIKNKMIFIPINMIIWFKRSRADIFEDIEAANIDLENGNLNDAHHKLQGVYSKYGDKTIAQKSYLNYLYRSGQYKRVVENIKNNKNIIRGTNNQILDDDLADIFKKSKRNIELMGNIYSNLDILAEESPYSLTISRKYSDKLLRTRKFNECFDFLENIQVYFSKDPEILKTKYHLMICQGGFVKGIRELKKYDDSKLIYELEKLHGKFKEIKNELKNVEKEAERTGRYFINILERIFSDLNSLLNKINPIMLGDSFQPSIFYHLKFLVLNEIVIVGIKLSKKGLHYKAKEVLKYKNTDNEKYNHIHCLIIDENIEAIERELDKTEFKNKKFKTNLINHLSIMKERKRRKEKELREEREREERERKKKEEQRRRQQQQRNQGFGQRKGKSAGEDYKGYYKTLGVNKSASEKDIKKKYRKLVRDKNPDKYKDKDEKKYKELSEEMMKINQAKDVLLDKEKRQKYDNGILDDDQRGGFQFSGGDFSDIFSTFFGGGGTTFFENSSHSGGGRRYYYSSSFL